METPTRTKSWNSSIIE